MDIIFESIIENLDVKIRVFKEIEKYLSEQNSSAILSSNTISFPISEISYHLQQPNNMIGIRFLAPVTFIPFVEITFDQVE